MTTDMDPCGPYRPLDGPLSFSRYPMRVGTKLGRTLYLKTGEGEKAKDTFAGVVDSVELAQEIMKAVNHYYGHSASED